MAGSIPPGYPQGCPVNPVDAAIDSGALLVPVNPWENWIDFVLSRDLHLI
jgi:hypothetical protein